MAILLPRARLNLSSPVWQPLGLDNNRLEYFQALLDESTLELQLQKQFNSSIHVVSSTAILPSNFCKQQWHEQALASKSSPDVMIFVSKHAAFLGSVLIPETHLRAAQCFAVGKTAANFFPDMSIHYAGMGKEHAAGLLELDSLKNLTGKSLWIIKGEQGLDSLESACRERGAQVEVLNFYTRAANTEQSTQGVLEAVSDIDFIYGVSVYALEHLLELCDAHTRAHCLKRPLKAMSERIAQAARALGFEQVDVLQLNQSENLHERSVQNTT